MIIKIIFKINSLKNILFLKLFYRNRIIIGKNVNIRGNIRVRIDKNAKIIINEGCFFNNGCSLNVKSNLIIGCNTIFGENVKVYDHNHIFNKNSLIKDSGYKISNITIGDNCWICSDVTILKGVNIGNNSVISTKEIVRGSIDANCILKNGFVKKISYENR